ncbi:MAG: glycosyltransferase family 39 protein, partial [Ignavibacteriales bacterium]|nr:glycosyltransferase family 39 protein [Ignavibacteriales bacterium]
IVSFFLFLIGFSLLLLLLPRETPFESQNFQRVGHEGVLVFRFDIPLLGPIHFSGVVLFVAFVALALTVFLGARPIWRDHLTTCRNGFRPLLAAILLCATLVPPEWYFVSAGSMVALTMMLSTLCFALAIVGAIRLKPPLRLFEAFETSYHWLRRILLESSIRLFLPLVFLAAFALTLSFSTVVFERIPHVQDSIAQLFHAKILAAGHLTAPTPPAPEFFEFLQMILRDRWYSQYPPGHIALLAIGVIAGAPWMVNPLFGSLAIVMLYAIGRQVYTERVGRIAALLGLLSPFVLFMSSEYMNHGTALFFFLSFIHFFMRGLTVRRLRDGILAGLSLGWLTLTRPYSAVALALPFLIYGAVILIRNRSSVVRPAFGFVISFGLLVLLLLGFNAATTGNPFVFGFQALWGARVNPGFFEINAGEVHTPFRGLQQTVTNLIGLNKYLFEWPVPSLLFVAILFAAGKLQTVDRLFLGSAAALVMAYFFYWFQDWCFGPRFLYEAAGPLILLTARGMDETSSLMRGRSGLSISAKAIRMATVGLVIILFGLGMIFNLPAHLRYYSLSYWGVDGRALEVVRSSGITRGIVFVGLSDFGDVFPENDPFMWNGLIFARDLGENNQKLLDAYPHLPAWRLRPDSVEAVK